MAEFDIKLQGKTVGKASVEKQGLYYRFNCQCNFSDQRIHTVWICWEGGSRKLGVCVPNGVEFRLETKVPVKYLPNSGLTFTVDYSENKQDDFYPVYAEQPFSLVDKLSQAHFDLRGDKPGLVIPK